jgi:CHAT domain-containing protein/tetratricopeptide (TPR) repeat protein
LTRPSDKHIDGDELDRIVAHHAAATFAAGELPERALAEARSHAESCPACHRKMQMHKDAQSELSRLLSQGNPPAGTAPADWGADCTGEDEWLAVAAGLLSETDTKEKIKHAAQCARCGPFLREATETLAEEATRDEEDLLAGLNSARPEWRKVLASTMREQVAGKSVEVLGEAVNKDRSRQPYHWWRPLFAPRPAFALAGCVVVIAAAWLGLRVLRPPSAQELLAQAYTERRTLEPRIAGAKYAPMRVERGPGASNLDKPPALLKAEALIGENLRQHPNDPAWLQARARADLLDGNYDSAIKSLQRALETTPDSPLLLTDLGSAYFLRAESADRPLDYGNAVESLGKALAKTPDDPIALFNRALACERLYLYTQAVDDWQHYLRIDPAGEWSNDARARLSALQEKIKQHEKSQAEPLLTPEEIVAGLSSSQAKALSEIDGRAEEYLDEAITRWLPLAFAANDDSEKARVTLEALATVLVSDHRDTWLRDLLFTPPSSSLLTGLRRLSDASAATSRGDPDAALLNAHLAESWFQRAGSGPGVLRARLEEIYALHRQYHGRECMMAIAKTRDQLRGGTYPWIETQVALEHYACLDAKETQLDSAKQLIATARTKAQRANYRTLYLRALAFSASSETESGSTVRAWEWDREGLRLYWSGHYPPIRAQHLYDDLTISAKDSERWHLAVVLGREAVAAIAASPNRTGEGIERMQLAQSASQTDLWPEAGDEYSQALKAFSVLPLDKSTRAFRATAEIGLGDLALSQKRADEAGGHLAYARANLPPDFEDDQTWLSLYDAWSEFRRQSGDSEGERKACIAAIEVAEISLAGVHSEAERRRWNRSASGCYKRLVALMLNDHDESSALELWEQYQSAGARSPQFEPGPVPLFAEMERSPVLPASNAVRMQMYSLDRETVVVYADLDDQISAWVYDDRGIFWKPLEVRPADLKSAASRFALECSDPDVDVAEIRVAGRRLYDYLFAPVASYLDPSRTLVIEASETISSIPFAAIVAPDGNYLIDRFSLAYLPSLGFRKLLRESFSITREDFALVVGAPALAAGDQSLYPPLPDAAQEAEAVAKAFSHALRLEGTQARSAAVAAALPGAGIFHFAGHTRALPGHSGLLLAPETETAGAASSLLSADEIADLSLPRLRLAVLSACSTGGELTDAASPISIAQAFLRTGSPNVLATRWRVDSAATTTFIHAFYSHALGGEDIPQAVAASMKEVRSQYSHPYYWAAFEAFGRGAGQRKM